MTPHVCRGCGAPLHHTFVDLGVQPLANSFVEPDALNRMEPFYPLHVLVCEACHLVQLPEVESEPGEASRFFDFAESIRPANLFGQ